MFDCLSLLTRRWPEEPGPRLSLCCRHWRTRGSETARAQSVSKGQDREAHLVIDRVPGHTVDRPHVAAEHCDGVVPLDVVYVDLRGDHGV